MRLGGKAYWAVRKLGAVDVESSWARAIPSTSKVIGARRSFGLGSGCGHHSKGRAGHALDAEELGQQRVDGQAQVAVLHDVLLGRPGDEARVDFERREEDLQAGGVGGGIHAAEHTGLVHLLADARHLRQSRGVDLSRGQGARPRVKFEAPSVECPAIRQVVAGGAAFAPNASHLRFILLGDVWKWIQ